MQLLHQAGEKPLRNTWIFFGSYSGDEFWDVFVANMIGVIVDSKQIIIQSGMMDELMFDVVISNITNWKKRPDAAIWYAMAWAEGRKP